MDVNNVNIENEAIDRTIPFFICFYIVRIERKTIKQIQVPIRRTNYCKQ